MQANRAGRSSGKDEVDSFRLGGPSCRGGCTDIYQYYRILGVPHDIYVYYQYIIEYFMLVLLDSRLCQLEDL